MTNNLAECELALSNVRGSIESERRFPQNVFRGDWNEFLFFDSDWMRAADFVDRLKELLLAENGTCVAMVNLDLTSGDRAGSLLFVHKDTAPNEYQVVLGNPGLGTGWLTDLDRLACASNTGEWSMYCEPALEIAVVGFRQTVPQSYRQILARFHASRFADTIKEPDLSYGFSRLSSTWRDGFLREYAPRP
jgi:hypothetical protein